MKNIFAILFLLFSFSCAQESAEIIYRRDNPKRTKNNSLKPSYMKGSYVEDSNKQLVRDLKKDYSQPNKIENSKNCDRVVIVNNGDSLLKIARKCGCTLADIASVNNIKPPYNVYAGQKIKTNCNGKVTDIDVGKSNITYKTVAVEKGSSLIRIAIDNNSTLRELATINSIEPPYNVYVGQKIKVPIKKSSSSASKNENSNKKSSIDSNKNTNTANNDIYVVKKGDNIYSIARKTNSSFSELITNNNLKKPYNIYVGQKLKITAAANVQTKNITESNGLERVKEDTEPIANNKQETTTIGNSESMFIWPIKGEIIKKFGKQDDGSFNDAINIKSAKGVKVQAIDEGEVAYAGNELKGFGNIIILKHKNGWLSVYGHCDTIDVKVKDRVKKGQTIAVVGSSGNVTEPQLYFSLRKGRTAMDPLKYLTNN